MAETQNGDPSANFDEGSRDSSISRSLDRKYKYKSKGARRLSNWSQLSKESQGKQEFELAEDPDGTVESILNSPRSRRQGRNKTFSTWRRERRRTTFNSARSKRIIRDMHKVIFPDGKWIRRWDSTILGIIVVYIFYLPFQIGKPFSFVFLLHFRIHPNTQ